MRIGQGFDVHAFTSGDHLILGGVRVPFDQSFAAHSDGDVLLHAICDALLGAAGLNDIGTHFPDTDPGFENADSRDLLRQVVHKLSEIGFVCVNIDSTVIAQAPKLAPYIDSMVHNIAADTGLETHQVNVKATTTEQLGFCGRGEGIAAMAVVLLQAAQ
ncbi:MAG: 2-C-methyl-D-erythritol 2,4-cyclodiphosphate synthase [Gammaproteobacteria bacterium]|nr:2-C-methyl-D-erythritol 2,4-cyclodiphosphate synthase [Gammaproteobacteria bacterium]